MAFEMVESKKKGFPKERERERESWVVSERKKS